MFRGSRSHFLTQPGGNCRRIESDRSSDLKTRDAVRCYELVDLTLRDAQELRDICDEEGAPY